MRPVTPHEGQTCQDAFPRDRWPDGCPVCAWPVRADLPIVDRQFSIEGQLEYVSGAQLLDTYEHDHVLRDLLRALGRGGSGEYRGAGLRLMLTRLW